MYYKHKDNTCKKYLCVMHEIHVHDRCGFLPSLSILIVKWCNISLDCQQVYQEVGNGAIGFGIYATALSSALPF